MEENQSNSNQRIAKNTLILYFRMFITMLVGLYTSRIVLATLGVSDYGLYNVVGGLVSMFTFLNGSMAAGTQRFLTFELGRGIILEQKKVFNCSILVHLVLLLIIIILAETIGLWFLYHKMQIDPVRFNAAIWVYQFSVLACAISIFQVPFMATLIAHEKMNIYAYMSIYDVVVKLLIVYLIQIASFDKLVFYAFLILLTNISSAAIYNIYCRVHYIETRFSLRFDSVVFKKIFSFSAWDVIGSIASLAQTQGINIILNMFCGTVINAARGIAVTINNIVMSLVNNFTLASSPQLVKLYSVNQIDKMAILSIHMATMSNYLLIVVGIPIFIEIEFLLKLWLIEYPDYTPVFVRIILIQSFIQSMGTPAMKTLHAIGKIKMMNLIIGSLLVSILPVSYLLFKYFNLEPATVMIINIAPWGITIPIRMILLRRYCDFPASRYMNEVVLKGIVLTGIIYVMVCIGLSWFQGNEYIRLIFTIILNAILSSLFYLYFGFTKSQRLFILNRIINKLHYRNGSKES